MIKTLRIGNGIDIHQLKKRKTDENRPFLLGGVSIESNYIIEAHSDGDILYHAMSDALLGAISLGDIGEHFPDTIDTTKNMNSEAIFLFCLKEVRRRGYHIANIDSTIQLQKPKLRPHIETIKSHIAQLASLEVDQISIKATTTEHLGYVGREEGIVVYSTVLLYK